ncbi:ATP synthase F1 subunit epsilon [Candidatus Saccharibacteria bacterium]|nr:ATP synthase F1 subunit epsilon [Candidatus Saccharibacteria bacterium]NCU40789.1 ATP synthase F1 subunit epsilon [Candidatus Saccharibacteria bacterium]
MNLKLVTLGGELLNTDVYEVIIPTIDGEISVFPDHEPLIAVAKSGVVAVRYEKNHSDDYLKYFAISGGVIEISGKSVKILVDEADQDEDIIEAETQAALSRAIEMRDNAKDSVELDKAHQLIDRHMVQLKVADLHRRKRKI